MQSNRKSPIVMRVRYVERTPADKEATQPKVMRVRYVERTPAGES